MRSVLTLLTAVMLGACSTQIPTSSTSEMARTSAYNMIMLDQVSGATLTLPDQPWLEDTVINVIQQVSAKWKNPTPQSGQDRATFIARIAINADRVKITVLDDLGRRALDIDWTENALDITTADWVSGMVDGRRLLADMVMTYWPVDVVRSALGTDLSISETGNKRMIKTQNDGDIFMQINRPDGDPWQGQATLRNLALGYDLAINSRRMTP
ncbi:DUF3261 domain-containing protein [Thalassospira sp. CH_XMU1448-2]|uniref:DUF3261 domain-containing protein n=1 Tax=Thalassospira sp. CH_XMU1448-2 TaxID=3107773 RepID=UPI00300A41C4